VLKFVSKPRHCFEVSAFILLVVLHFVGVLPKGRNLHFNRDGQAYRGLHMLLIEFDKNLSIFREIAKFYSTPKGLKCVC
jgi:hypothetical protein